MAEGTQHPGRTNSHPSAVNSRLPAWCKSFKLSEHLQICSSIKWDKIHNFSTGKDGSIVWMLSVPKGLSSKDLVLLGRGVTFKRWSQRGGSQVIEDPVEGSCETLPHYLFSPLHLRHEVNDYVFFTVNYGLKAIWPTNHRLKPPTNRHLFFISWSFWWFVIVASD